MATNTKSSKKPILSLRTAVKLLNLKMDEDYGGGVIPTDVSDINLLCPECSQRHSGRRHTMNLNFDDNVFHCARCGFGGGVYKLISYYTGWTEKEVPNRIKNGELANYKPSEGNREEEEVTDVSNHGRLIAPLATRDKAYRAMLAHLTLSVEHEQDLLRRGMSKLDIERIGFKSLSRFMDPVRFTKRLITEGIDLRQVPGFGIDANGDWSLARQPDNGYLIPIMNAAGLIQGFQIRYEHPNNVIPKYGYFTSKGMTGGTRCEPWCNWVGMDFSDKGREPNPFDVIVIEGPLKSYIVNSITGANLLAVPGVNALKNLPSSLQELKERGMQKVYIAYDMDAKYNKDVNNQLNRLRQILAGMSIVTETMTWNEEYKGLDDYITCDPEFLAIRASLDKRH